MEFDRASGPYPKNKVLNDPASSNWSWGVLPLYGRPLRHNISPSRKKILDVTVIG
ncbi:hypothetical protein BY996DRAFT_6549500 [Phakopsora pachyrhizi]|nr:hypothetical protein BY996DRAFT_6549500 [Phakopsora pachyrhizi]